MATLTTSTNVTILNTPASQESITLTVVAGSGAVGKGRMIHPYFGTLDYTLPPHEWTNIDSDLIVPPVWSSSKTLSSTAHTLWAGNLRDVEVQETWLPEAGLSMPLPMLRMLINYWVNPPSVTDGEYLQWWPSYTSALGYRVIITGIEVDGEPLKMTPQTKYTQLVEFPVTVRLRVIERIQA